VLSGRGLCNGLITRPEESYRLWHVVVCDQETSNEEAEIRYRAVKNTTKRVVMPRKQTNKLFHLYINDFTKIINETLALIIFADDTNILFAHSNLTDFNKNTCIVFTTLNKWLRANQLSLNFNTTNYVYFTTKKNMSVNLKIGFNNNFITNSSNTKFLGMTMNNTLSSNNHVDLLMKKLSKACYIIRNAKTYMSALSLKVIYYAFFFFFYELWNYILGKLVA
jgi:hypothetical protein